MKSLLNISDLGIEDFNSILKNAKSIKPNEDFSLKNKNIGLIFEKNSTRTRLSFQVGINQLGGKYIDINLKDLNLQRIESFEDTFEIMGCYLDALIFRTTDHKKLEIASKYFNKPIINALSDMSHPCQAISDIFTLQEYFQRDDNFNIVWCGDLNNVLYSLLEALKFLKNSKINIFTNQKVYETNQNFFPSSERISYKFEIDDKILSEADCIMTDVFNSMNDNVDKEGVLNKFQVNDKLMKKTPEHSVFMHCLPAKIGSEVTKNVIKGSKSIIIRQAFNRTVSQRGIMKWLDL